MILLTWTRLRSRRGPHGQPALNAIPRAARDHATTRRHLDGRQVQPSGPRFRQRDPDRDHGIRDDPTSLLQYSTTEGFPLRAWIAEQAAASRGREVDPDQVLITHGSQQALDLVSKVFVDPGVEVAIDEPGYIGAIQALQVFEPALLPVPVDDGIDSGALESLLAAGHRPRVLYTVVNFQNPTGATLSLERRMHLAELAEKFGFVIVEDDPYWALRVCGRASVPCDAW